MEQPDISSARDMSAPAQLKGEIAYRQHAYVLLVLFTEQGHGPRADRLFVVHEARVRCGVRADLRVHEPLDLGELEARNRLEMRKVEAQSVRGDQRALLRH